MVLVDTSVWIDHLHRAETTLVDLLDQSRVCLHPMVIGELALGSIKRRSDVLALLTSLPPAVAASHAEGVGADRGASALRHGAEPG